MLLTRCRNQYLDLFKGQKGDYFVSTQIQVFKTHFDDLCRVFFWKQLSVTSPNSSKVLAEYVNPQFIESLLETG